MNHRSNPWQPSTRRAWSSGLLVLVLAVLAGRPASAAALHPDKAGWYHTGSGMLTTDVALFTIDVFEVRHEMRCLPDHKSKVDVIAADCDKRLRWLAMREVDARTIQKTLRDAYQAVDYHDDAKIRRAISVLARDLPEGARVTISYDAATSGTTFSAPRGQRITVRGDDFMRATWRVLFANADLHELGDALISKL